MNWKKLMIWHSILIICFLFLLNATYVSSDEFDFYFGAAPRYSALTSESQTKVNIFSKLTSNPNVKSSSISSNTNIPISSDSVSKAKSSNKVSYSINTSNHLNSILKSSKSVYLNHSFLINHKTNTSLVSKINSNNLFNSFIFTNNFLAIFESNILNINSTDINSTDINSTDVNISLDNPVLDLFTTNNPYIDQFLVEQLSSDLLFPPERIISSEEYKNRLIAGANNRNGANENSNSTVPNFTGTLPTSGNIHVPVLLVDFSDKAHTLSADIFENHFNSTNYLPNQDITGISVSSYYTRQSYGDLNITFDIYGWQTLTNNTYEYYKSGNATQFEMIIDTINLYDSQIDYTQYDSDDDGRIDAFVIIPAGDQYNMPPQARILKEYYSNMVDNLYLGDVALVSEVIHPVDCNTLITTFDYPTDCRSTVTMFTHELGHTLGLPELYAVNPTTGQQVGLGLSQLSMMSWGQFPQKPINLDPWSRFYLGWMNETFIGTFGPSLEEHTDLCNSSILDLRSVNQYPDIALVSNASTLNDREFFLIENRYVDINDPNNLDIGSDMIVDTSNCTGHLGPAIYHIDEQYIEDNFLTNSIMYDSDGNMWDDTVSHPGIVFEQNIWADTGFTQFWDQGDFYLACIGNIPEFGDIDLSNFNKNEYLLPGLISNDTTSNSYAGFENSRIAFKVLESGIPTAKVRIDWQKCYLEDGPVCSVLDVSSQCGFTQ